MNAYKSLVEMKPGEEGTIVDIQAGMGLHRRLNAMRIVPGVRIRKIGGSFLGGPVTIQIGNARSALGYGMAAKVMVMCNGVPPR
jgi:ferrous iron transport protein A